MIYVFLIFMISVLIFPFVDLMCIAISLSLVWYKRHKISVKEIFFRKLIIFVILLILLNFHWLYFLLFAPSKFLNKLCFFFFQLTKRHRNGHMIKVDWLDRLTFREIELINEKEKRSSNFMFLMIEFPTVCAYGIEYTVVYFEEVCMKWNKYNCMYYINFKSSFSVFQKFICKHFFLNIILYSSVFKWFYKG